MDEAIRRLHLSGLEQTCTTDRAEAGTAGFGGPGTTWQYTGSFNSTGAIDGRSLR
jgi:hypothetical protein